MRISHEHRLCGLLIFVLCRIFCCTLVSTTRCSSKIFFCRIRTSRKLDLFLKTPFFKLYVNWKVVDSRLFEILSKSMSEKWAKNPFLPFRIPVNFYRYYLYTKLFGREELKAWKAVYLDVVPGSQTLGKIDGP